MRPGQVTGVPGVPGVAPPPPRPPRQGSGVPGVLTPLWGHPALNAWRTRTFAGCGVPGVFLPRPRDNPCGSRRGGRGASLPPYGGYPSGYPGGGGPAPQVPSR